MKKLLLLAAVALIASRRMRLRRQIRPRPAHSFKGRAYAAAVTETVEVLAAAPEVLNVADPFESRSISQDGTIGFANVTYAVAGAELTDEAKEALEAAPEAAREAGLVVEIGGDALAHVPHTGSAEVLGLLAAIVVLLFTFGSVVAAGLPILTALIGVGLDIGIGKGIEVFGAYDAYISSRQHDQTARAGVRLKF